MPDIAVAIRNRLLANGAVAGKIGTRYYPRNRPQDSVLPAARYNVLSDTGEEHLKGSNGVQTARVQIDIFSKGYIDSRDIGRMMIAAIATPGTDGQIRFGRTRWEGPVDAGGEDIPGGEFVYMARVDLLVEYTVNSS